jgi:hypothetical protein
LPARPDTVRAVTRLLPPLYEAFLMGCVRPDYLLPAYYLGYHLAESFCGGAVFELAGDHYCRSPALPG